MDIPYESPSPDPPVTPQAGQAQPDLLIGGVSGDPLCRILDGIEASIEQPVSISNMYADPLCRTLDRVEASVEQHCPAIDRLPEPLHETLSRLENEIEHQSPMVPSQRQNSPEEVAPPAQYVLPQLNKQSRITSTPSQRPEAVHRESLPPRQHSEPAYRMTGHYTGIRNSGNEFDWYCNIHRQWVTEDECNDCPDFEETDYVTEDEEDKRCRHSFLSASEEQDKNADENFDFGEETDE